MLHIASPGWSLEPDFAGTIIGFINSSIEPHKDLHINLQVFNKEQSNFVDYNRQGIFKITVE